MKKYVVTRVDYGEGFDVKARVLGIYDYEKDALAFVRFEIKSFYNLCKDVGFKIDYDKMSARLDNNSNERVEWNVEEFDEDDNWYIRNKDCEDEKTLEDMIDNLKREVANLKDRIKYLKGV